MQNQPPNGWAMSVGAAVRSIAWVLRRLRKMHLFAQGTDL